MSFDEEDIASSSEASGDANGKNKPKTFFGMELGDGMVYAIVIFLTIVFIRQVVVVLQALN